MRIISGKYKGRKMLGHDIEGTRPTMDRVRESLFAMIQDYLKESIILDLFAGSGTLGIEALSNGAKFCYFNDKNKKCTSVINNNLDNLKEMNAEVLNKDYKEILKHFVKGNIKFNIIFLDPPYSEKIINEIIEYIIDNRLLLEDGIIIAEVNSDYIATEKIKIYKQRKFSDKEIIIFKK